MSHKTIHGLKPANDLLNDELILHLGSRVTIQYRCSQELFGGKYNLLRESDGRLIEMVPNSFEWANKGNGPEGVDWSQFSFTIYPSTQNPTSLWRHVQYELSGLEDVPGLSRKPGLPWSWAFRGSAAYFEDDSPLVLEYRRRFTLEAAQVLRQQADARITKLLAQEPFLLD